MPNMARVATAMFLLFVSSSSTQAISRLVTDPACQIILKMPGKPAVRSGPPVYLPGHPGKPLAYRDPETKILFYAESDGRHLAAIGSDGKLLWVRNPFDDKGLCPYRNARPVLKIIERADPAEIKGYLNNPNAGLDVRDHYIRIDFDSSQFGLVNQRTGDFFFEGQN